MIKVGLTGGIGSGKSYVAGIFQSLGIPVFNSDNIAREITADLTVIDRIKSVFGKDVLSEDGTINRKVLGALVFSDPDKLRALNIIIHPEVESRFQAWVTSNKGAAYVLKESAILFESGSYQSVDKVINVLAPEEIRIQRTLERDKEIPLDQIKAIMKQQLSEEDRCNRSDYIIVNNGTTPLLPQVLVLDKKLRDADN